MFVDGKVSMIDERYLDDFRYAFTEFGLGFAEGDEVIDIRRALSIGSPTETRWPLASCR